MQTSMRAFDVLIGEWDVEVPQFPGARGHATFAWIEDGAYLRLQSDAPDPAPSAIWIIGSDDSAESRTALYHDSRGVARVYRMSLDAAIWRIWRDAPGFCQRYTGTLNSDGGSIRGAWEKSADGSVWEKDFDMHYTRV
jgi:hypothetical protein